jgi:hypothetical protein
MQIFLSHGWNTDETRIGKETVKATGINVGLSINCGRGKVEFKRFVF